MKTGEIINVFYNERPVGTLAITANHIATAGLIQDFQSALFHCL